MSNLARETYNKGDRVQWNGHKIKSPDRIGTVTGYSRDPHCVQVLWDGLKASSTACIAISLLKRAVAAPAPPVTPPPPTPNE